MVESVAILMLQDHGVIIRLLQDFEEGRENNPKQAMPLFDKFQWKLERHILIEERVIFSYTAFSRDSNDMLRKVIEEHKIILEILKGVQRELFSGNWNVDISDFRKILDEHRMFEDKELYPRLDKELKPPMKQFMIDQLMVRLS